MVIQLLLNAIIAGSVYALVGVGFSLIFRVVHFFDFTYGLSFTFGAYGLFALITWTGAPFAVAVVLAVTATVLVALAVEASVFRQLRMRSGAPGLASFIASLGLYIVGQNAISMAFGDGARSVRPYAVEPGLELWGARITSIQLATIACSAATLLGVIVWLRFTATGRNLRAVGQNPELASIVGVSVGTVTALATSLGATMGAVAGILSALDRDIVPTMGMNALLMGIVATLVGGASRLLGVVLAAILVGLVQNLSILFVPAAWQEAIVFLVLLAFLLVRPQGFSGRPLRPWTV